MAGNQRRGLIGTPRFLTGIHIVTHAEQRGFACVRAVASARSTRNRNLTSIFLEIEVTSFQSENIMGCWAAIFFRVTLYSREWMRESTV